MNRQRLIHFNYIMELNKFNYHNIVDRIERRNNIFLFFLILYKAEKILV